MADKRQKGRVRSSVIQKGGFFEPQSSKKDKMTNKHVSFVIFVSSGK